MTPQSPRPHGPPHAPPFDTAPSDHGETPAKPRAVQPPSRLTPGTKPLPEYELVRKLGEGGYGQVWVARGPGGFEVALKFIPVNAEAGDTEMKSLQVLKGVRHANLLSLFGVWETDGWLIIAMELADRPLSERLKEAVQQGLPGIPRDELIEYMREAAKGLDLLNERGIIHRDVKPHNLFLSSSSVKVADYGLAKVLEKTVATVSMKMTPAYAAPEIMEGKGTKGTDQYSLAITYCHLRGNRLPYYGTLMEMMAAHLSKPPDLTMVPTEERPVVARALAKDPQQRWPNCKAFVEALAAVRVLRPPPLPTEEELESLDSLDSLPPKTQAPPSRTVPISAGGPRSSARTHKLPRPPVPPDADGARSVLHWIVLGSLSIILLGGLGVAAFFLLGNPNPPPVDTRTSDSRAKPNVETLTHTIPAPTKPAPPRSRPESAVSPFSAVQARRHQEEWAAYVNQPAEFENSVGMKFRLIPVGEFLMGSPEADEDHIDEEQQHRVRITAPFHMGAHEVTVGQFRAFVEETHFQTEGEKDGKGGWGWNEEQRNWKGGPQYTWKNPGFPQSDEHPVGNVSWNDAQAFCRWLSQKESRTYRLPTEAEWEYSCRAGSTSRFHSGNFDKDMLRAGNMSDAAHRTKTGGDYGLAEDDGHAFTSPRGKFAPNAWGLCDMHGNVAEWCQDGFDKNFYRNSPVDNPENKNTSETRVVRGGSYNVYKARYCRAAHRADNPANTRFSGQGFRVALTIPAPAP
jgi:sulfatase modifying factor 1